MKKFFVSAFLLGSFGVYVFSVRQGLIVTHDSSVAAVQSAVMPDAVPVSPVVTTTVPPLGRSTQKQSGKKSSATPDPGVLASPVVASATRGQFKDGEYTGSKADAIYGILQVKAVVTGGKLTDVQFLQYPTDRPRSVEINQEAMPHLKMEALQVQSASVDAISGASETSAAFVDSLGVALAQAHA